MECGARCTSITINKIFAYSQIANVVPRTLLFEDETSGVLVTPKFEFALPTGVRSVLSQPKDG